MQSINPTIKKASCGSYVVCRLTFLGLILLAVGLSYPVQTFGQVVEFGPFWTHVASACAVDDGSLSRYEFTGADFTFRPLDTSTTTLMARCNVLNPLDGEDPKWNALIVGFQDPDAGATDHRVRVSLVRVKRPTGGSSTVAEFIASTAVTTRTEDSTGFTHTWDFLNNEYYVQIELLRKVTTGKPRAYMVRLTNVQVIN